MATHPGSPTGWPATTLESVRWVGDVDAIPRRHRRAYSGDYQANVVPPIASANAHLSAGTRAALDEATAHIARFDADMSNEIAPLASILLRSESASSSRIEHLTASARAIAAAELGDTSQRNAAEIIANSTMMTAAIRLADRLDAESIIEMHRQLMEPMRPDIVGHWRTQPVWIGGSRHGPHTADFVPPKHERVPAAIDDLIAHLARDDVSVLEQAAIAHAQFETIHPFPDGNGRTGRAIVHSILRAKGLTRNVTVPVSAGLLQDVDQYFAALTRYRAGDPSPVVECFADASFAAAHHGRTIAADLSEVRARWQDALKVRSHAAAHRALDVVSEQPVVDVAYISQALGISDRRAADAIDALVSIDALRQIGSGQRNRRWQAPEILAPSTSSPNESPADSHRLSSASALTRRRASQDRCLRLAPRGFRCCTARCPNDCHSTPIPSTTCPASASSTGS